MSFEVRKLISFPIEKLYYGLKLEVLEQMEANDAVELAKVNAGFRSILLRKPWIVFGRHVHTIHFARTGMLIMKFPDDGKNEPHLFSQTKFSNVVEAKDDPHFPLIKRIHSCDILSIEFQDEQFSDEHAKILNPLNSVKHLYLHVYEDNSLLKVLENFSSRIGEYARIAVNVRLLKENQVLSELFKNFIASQVNHCEEVLFNGHSAAHFHFYNDAFAGSSIKFLTVPLMENADDFEEIVQSIVKRQIPSKNLRAAFLMYVRCSQEINARIVDFLLRFPGTKQLDEENQQEVIKMTTELLEKFNYSTDLRGGLFFRRNIDASRDCVYMLLPNIIFTSTFFAFYVQPQSEIMEF